MSLTDDVKAYLAKIGAKGGKKKSDAKTAASRLNAKKGGRPRMKAEDLTYAARKKRESRARLAKKQA